jgi:hypothetical protein
MTDMSVWNRLFDKREDKARTEPEDLSRILEPPAQASTPPAQRPKMSEDDFPTYVVGESHYQVALETICGSKQEYGQATWTDEVQLIPEDDNPYDPNAVRVEIEERQVGYLSRTDAVSYRRKHGKSVITCEAIIVGGWDRGHGDRGNYGVRLNLRL